jgi:hypothetical protein
MAMNLVFGTFFMSSGVSVTRRKGRNLNSPQPTSRSARQVLTALALAVLLIVPVTAVSINPIGTYVAGENINVTGSTSYAAGHKIWVEVSASDFHPTSKYASIEQLSGESKASGTVMVTKGPGTDGVWSIALSTKGWEPGEYTVRAADAAGDSNKLWASSSFNLSSAPAPDRTGTVSTSSAPSARPNPGAPDTNASGSSPGAGSTGPLTIAGISGDPGLSLPLLAVLGLVFSAGCGYYIVKMRPYKAPPPPSPRVVKQEHDNTGEKRPAVHPHHVFLSAKSQDYESANRVYSYLTEHGYSVFFSDQTLPRMGNSDYRREIDRALEQATHLIVVTSRKEYVESKWVEAEWGSFINEKRSGRKDGNIIVLLAGSMQIGDLPISLRSFETRFLDNPKTLEQILSYLS